MTFNIQSDNEQDKRALEFAQRNSTTIKNLARHGGNIGDVKTFLRVAARSDISDKDVANTIDQVAKRPIEDVGNIGALVTTIIKNRAKNRKINDQPADALLNESQETESTEEAVAEVNGILSHKITARFTDELMEGIKSFCKDNKNCSNAAAVRGLVTMALNKKVATVTQVSTETGVAAVRTLLTEALGKLDKVNETNDLDIFDIN